MSKNPQVKAAACRLGLEIASRVEATRLAVGENETIKTATDLSMVVLDNIDFIVYALKKVGGLNVSVEPISATSKALIKLPQLSSAITGINDD